MGRRHATRNSLLQQQLRRLHDRFAVKAILHRFIVEQIVQGYQAHALMMRHVSTHQRATFAFLDSLWRIVERFIKAVTGKAAFALQHSQVFNRPPRLNQRRENCRVRGDDEIFDQSAFETETGNTKRAILIIELQVARTVCRLRNAPRYASLITVLDLPRDDSLVSLAQQRFAIVTHHQQRHQVFEHRACPGDQRATAVD